MTMFKWMVLAVVVLGLGMAFVAPASTGEEGEGEPAVDLAAMQAWWMKMATPGENHRWMDFIAGDWAVEGTFWMGPGEPMTSAGQAQTSWILDKHYLRTTFASTFVGMPFQGQGTLGFNNASDKYESVWIDSMSTFQGYETGKREGDVITFRCQVPSPAGLMDSRDVLTKVDDDTYTFESFHTAPGQAEQQVMKLAYARKKKAE